MSTSVKEMTVASWEKVGSIELVTKKLPELKPGELLVKVAASGICGKSPITDIHHDTNRVYRYGLTHL